MPIGPVQILKYTNTAVVDECIKKIDALLGNATWCKDWKCGDGSTVNWSIVGPGTLTEGEKRELAARYLDAGWGTVDVRNSEDNGERPGLWAITLYVNKQDVGMSW